MRTTSTLDPDVAVLLQRVRDARGAILKGAVNEALRRGLKQLSEQGPQTARSYTEAVSLGRSLIGDLDDVAEALAVAEGEAFR